MTPTASRLAVTFLAAVLLAGAAAWSAPEPPVFRLALADGTTAAGPFDELGDSWSVRLDGSPPRQVAGADVLTLRRAGAPRPPFPAGEQVVFTNGDRLPGHLLELAGERLRLRAHLGKEQELSVPLTSLTVIWWAAPDAEDHAAPF